MDKKIIHFSLESDGRRFPSFDSKSFQVVNESELDVDKVDGKHASELGGMVEHGNEYHEPDFISTETDPTVDPSLKGVTKSQIQDHDPKAHIHDDRYYTETEIDTWKHDDEVEGEGGGFNADLVDGKHSSELGGGIPSGVIVMWSGLKANIPSGWGLCDGGEGRPDLRNKFILGVPDGEEAGGTGGAEIHTHGDHSALSHSGVAVQDHPALSHSGCAVADHPAHTHGTQPLTTVATAGSTKKGTTTASITESHTHTITIPDSAVQTHSVTQPSSHPIQTHSVTQPSNHPSQSHVASDHKPPYYKLCFIIKL